MWSLRLWGSAKSSHRRCSIKKVFLKISENSQENTCVRASFLINLQAETCNFIKKETLTQVFSCEFSEIFKNNFFAEQLRATDSVQHKVYDFQVWNMEGRKILKFHVAMNSGKYTA